MIIWVKLFGYLKKFTKKKIEGENGFEISLPEDSTIGNLLDQLAISPKQLIVVINPGEDEKVLALNGEESWRSFKIKEKDKIFIYPFYDGG